MKRLRQVAQRTETQKPNQRQKLLQIDVGQKARGSHDCEMIFNILCSFHYFRSYDFISLILGVFMTFLVKLGSCYGIVSIRICLGIFLLGK